MLIDNFYHIIERAEDKVTIQFNASHPIYAAHFPDSPITPGACLVKIAEEVIGKRITRISNLKFSKTVLPSNVVTFSFEAKHPNKYRITISDLDSLYAQFIATYLCPDSNV